MKNKNLDIKTATMYLQLQQLADITKAMIREGNVLKARHCIETIEEVFNNGTAEIRNAVVNVYVFSISTFIEIYKYNINELLTPSLQTEYYKQINTSGV